MLATAFFNKAIKVNKGFTQSLCDDTANGAFPATRQSSQKNVVHSVLVQFFAADAGLQGRHEIDGRGIDGGDGFFRRDTIADVALRAVIDYLILVGEGKNELLNLTILAIEGQNVITGQAIMRGNTARAIEESADEYLPVIIPACDRHLMSHGQARIEGNEGTLHSLWVIEHDIQRGHPKVANVEDLAAGPTKSHLRRDREITFEDQDFRITGLRIVEQALSRACAGKVATEDFPVGIDVVDWLIVNNLQIGVEPKQAHFAQHAIIKEQAILCGADETAHVDFPGVIDEGVLLHVQNIQILIKIQHYHIGDND